MKKNRNLKQKIVFYVMSVSILIAALITAVMSIGSVRSTNAVLLDNMQIIARTAAQNLSSNLHLLTERMYNFSTEPLFSDRSASVDEKEERFEAIENQIEFVWLSAYGLSGKKLYGDDSSPDSISDANYFNLASQTGNLAIGEPFYENGFLQLCVIAPFKEEGQVSGYLVGSYKYDILNDVLSQLVLGNTGGACILNQDGDIIGDRDLINVIEGKTVYDIFPAASGAGKFDEVMDFQTSSSIMTLNSKQQYTGYSPIPGTSWALFIHAPKREFMDTVYVTIAFSALMSLAVLLAAAAIVVPVSKKISNPLSLATRRLQTLSDGNLTEQVILSESNDETRILTDALAKTIASLKRYIEDIDGCLSTLAQGDYTHTVPDHFQGDFSSIRDSLHNIQAALNHSMQKMSLSSVNVSDCAKQLLEGSKEQGALLEDMKENMEAITSSISQNIENAKTLERCVTEAGEKTTLGESDMQNMLHAMSQIDASVKEISNVSLLIEDISRQTNLLSLNAAVEAARAGEAGKGFSVVANEINHLSSQTANALLETGSLIERSAETIQAGLKTAERTAKTFRDIAALTEEYRDISRKLSDTANDQTDAVSHANDCLESLHGIAGKNDGMAAESLAQAESLREFVSRVKIKSNTGGLS